MMLLEMMEGRHRLVLVPLRIQWAKFRVTNAFSMFKILFPIFSFVAAFSLLFGYLHLSCISFIIYLVLIVIPTGSVKTSGSVHIYLCCQYLHHWRYYCWRSICFIIYLVLIVIPTGSVKTSGSVHIYLCCQYLHYWRYCCWRSICFIIFNVQNSISYFLFRSSLFFFGYLHLSCFYWCLPIFLNLLLLLWFGKDWRPMFVQ